MKFCVQMNFSVKFKMAIIRKEIASIIHNIKSKVSL